MPKQDVYLNIKKVKELREILDEIPSWFPVCVGSNEPTIRRKFNIIGVVVHKEVMQRKVEFIIDADSIVCTNEESVYSEFVKE
jgi:hypothetical protein